jgi:NADH-quinone oxidoreductase subunit I
MNSETKIETTARTGDQPVGSDFDQSLLEYLDRELFKPEPGYRKALGKVVPLFGLIKGLKMTAFAIVSRKITVKYPEEKLQPADAFRGRHELLTSPGGEQLCICCNACAMICPVECISVVFEKAKDPESKKRILTEYNVDLTKCLFCGLCQESCPESCVILGKNYEYSDTNRFTGMLNVRKEDIERRMTEEEWKKLQETKKSGKASTEQPGKK